MRWSGREARGVTGNVAIRRMVVCGLAMSLGALVGVRAAAAASPTRWTLRVTLGSRTVEGMPLEWSEAEVNLLARDGRLWSFTPAEATDFKKVSDSFRAWSQSDIRDQLRRELGRGFEVNGTAHYVVAHPVGQRDLWNERFEELYRSFTHYFAVRGLRLREPEFPLVAIVFATQAEFLRYARGEGLAIGGNVLGYYSPRSNRISLFDIGAGQSTADQWQANADTIIHEAAHQTAYNTGVHRRFAATPRWVVEGLGTMFEAPGVWDSRAHTRLEDRINRGRLADFKAMAGNLPDGVMAAMVSSDRLFEVAPAEAYAEAWALSFFLVEKHHEKYCRYLELTAARPAFSQYGQAERLADFTKVFGSDLRLLEAHFTRFISELK